MVDYKGAMIKVVIICPIHGKFDQIPVNHYKHGCNDCGYIESADKNSSDTEEFINRAISIHGETYDYKLVDYQKAQEYVAIICKNHGKFKQTPASHLWGRGCPKCNSSKGELAVIEYLKSHNIDFETQKKFDDCRNKRPLPFDFYVEKIGLLIEFDGVQHYKPVQHFGGEEALKKRQMRDKIKNKYAEENNYYLVRIRDVNNIEHRLELYVELYNLDSKKYFIHKGKILYNDLDEIKNS
jgi:very-short-patch-repair endonuclease